ncbi:unnamed protein product [Ilex paraguariensis]|uniref:Uncharacterized protein n=1 Tax=Ilex paraguariensis TaxID=185542 RepID=A0ABC8S0J4_9AQUA
MGVPTTGPVRVDLLSERAAMMRESLQKSQSSTDNMVSILGSFDHRLSALETAMRPTQIRTHAIRTAHENIDKTLKAAEVILTQFDLSRQKLKSSSLVFSTLTFMALTLTGSHLHVESELIKEVSLIGHVAEGSPGMNCLEFQLDPSEHEFTLIDSL